MILDMGTKVYGKYKVVDKLGVGGMAVVYHAVDESLDRDVTLKVLKEEFISDNEFVKRFRAEAKAAAKLNHQNISRIYDYGNDGDIYFIAMEYVEGCTLKEIIKNKAPLSVEETISVALQIAEGLMHAHNHGVIHRDIKPQNILVTKDGKHGNIKVTDFGIARAASSNTIGAEAVGSVHYFAPEQARGMFTDARSDIYSLGIVMFEMITGRLPFLGDNIVEMAIKHSNDPIPDIKSLNPKASKSIIKIIDKCTRKLAAERYQNAEELINDLRMALNDDSGKFVVENNIVDDGRTLIATHKELQEIRNKTKDPSEIISDADIDETDIADNEYDETEEEYENRKKELRVVAASALLAIAIISLLSFGIYYVYANVINPTVVVPQFVDLTIEEAEELAEKKGLTLSKLTVNNNKVAAGIVMEQSVDKGSRVAKKARINLTVSLGSATVPMPNILDKTEEEAVALLKERNIHIDEIKYENNERIPVGTVIRQTPQAGVGIGKDDEVKFYVSLGTSEERVVVPDVVNKTKEEAQLLLSKFNVKFIEGYSDTYPAGRIAVQGIPAGTEVTVGYTITVTVSKGPDPSLKKTEETTVETTTAAVAAPVTPAKRAVSIPVIPDFVENPPTKTIVVDNATGEEVVKDEDGNIPEDVSTSLKVVEDDAYRSKNYHVKAVAIDAENSRILYEKDVTGSEFPFSVNDQIDKDTNYKIYIDNTVILEKEEKY